MKAADDFIVPLTLCTEASNQSSECRQWICWVIYNRSRDPRYPDTMAAVCLDPEQFSAFNRDRGDWADLRRCLELPDNDPQWLAALADYHLVMGDIASGAIDPTQGATSFYADTIAEPTWAASARFVGEIGSVRFYANVK